MDEAAKRIALLESLLAEALPVIQRTEVNVYPESLSMRIVRALEG